MLSTLFQFFQHNIHTIDNWPKKHGLVTIKFLLNVFITVSVVTGLGLSIKNWNPFPIYLDLAQP